ncbi:Carboxylesterase [Hibiscus syriacus]|uniref:Carboxylesterase n=1 Tax=Hibiscus syriacus TaxID=106335 RepID=A0A6A3BE41_HIBSY|nr:Carboxylesterase [Hibiscus syriacus]
MSYWGKWDSSPNRHLIHEIIGAFEDELARSKKTETKSKKERKTKGGSADNSYVDLNSILPPTIVILAAALSSEEKQVLAYLFSCSINDFDNLSSHRGSTRSKKTKSKIWRKIRKGGYADDNSVGLKETKEDSGELNTVEPRNGRGGGCGDGGEEGTEKGPVRRLVYFIGKNISNVLG